MIKDLRASSVLPEASINNRMIYCVLTNLINDRSELLLEFIIKM